MSITIPEMFEQMEERYVQGFLKGPRSYYFSIGPHKYTVDMRPDGCTVHTGKTNPSCDCVLKTTEPIFLALVMRGERPRARDIMRGRFKTNSVPALMDLQHLLDTSAPG